MSIRRLLLVGLILSFFPVLACARQKPQGQQHAGGQLCGGIAALPCPEGLVCQDDPSDTCDPNQGGRDCSGLCVDPGQGTGGSGAQCDYQDPAKDYISKNPERCAVIRFACDPNEAPFFNDCGCGCEVTQAP